MVFLNPISQQLFVCGGENNRKGCKTLEKGGQWTDFRYNAVNISKLTTNRIMASAATTETGTYIFGGQQGVHSATYEYMPSSKKTWTKGNDNIPNGFDRGCAVAISENEIWLIGGKQQQQRRRVLAFYPKNHTFIETNIKLTRKRHSHRCTLMPDKSGVMITGGTNESTEIIDFKTRKSTFAGNMNVFRSLHGIGALVIENKPTLVVFGGYAWSEGDQPEKYHDSIEKYDHKTKKWTYLDIKLKVPRREFGFVTLKQPLNICKDDKK